MLLALEKKLLAAVTKNDTYASGLPVGSLTEIALYATPRFGEIDGIGMVTIDGEANRVGFSPVTKCRDAHGETAWIPTELVRNISTEPFGFTKKTTTRK